MGVGFKRNYTTSDIPVWQGKGSDIQLAQGGFGLDRTGLTDATILKAGTPMEFNETTRLAKPLSVGVINADAGGSATSYQVKKGHSLRVGQNFAAKAGNKAYPITAIDTTNAAYDVITVSTTIGAVTAGDFVYASTTTGASNSSFGGVNSLLLADMLVADGESVACVIRGTIYARRVPYSADLAAALKANGAYIIYSQSY